MDFGRGGLSSLAEWLRLSINKGGGEGKVCMVDVVIGVTGPGSTGSIFCGSADVESRCRGFAETVFVLSLKGNLFEGFISLVSPAKGLTLDESSWSAGGRWLSGNFLGIESCSLSGVEAGSRLCDSEEESFVLMMSDDVCWTGRGRRTVVI